jgi:two-component system cell cycle response regulator DivK
MAKVLVVEDNMLSQTLVTDILSMNGHVVLHAATGSEALRRAASDAPDIILMDINLPEMDGVTAVRLIRGMDASKAIPVLALTASALKGDEDKFIKQGFDGYVSKPIDVKLLIRKIEECLCRKTPR